MQPQIERLIPRAYQRKLQLTAYIVGEAEAKKTSQIMKAVMDDEESPDRFLKRVRKKGSERVEVIICRKGHHESEAKLKAVEGMIIETKQMNLPKHAPLTPSQYEQWSAIWPVNFVRQEIIRPIPHTPPQLAFISSLASADHAYCLFKDGQLLLTGEGECSDGTIDHPIMKMLALWPQCQAFQANPEEWYFLTGVSLFTKNNNLCGMCCMALVHSRLSRLYLQQEPSPDMDMIMGCPQLNHQVNMLRLM